MWNSNMDLFGFFDSIKEISIFLQKIMFVLYKIATSLIIPAEQYTISAEKAIRNVVMGRYLFKIVTSARGICIQVKSISIIDNVLLRKTADMRAEIELELIILKLTQDQYFQGEVIRASEDEGILVSFAGILEGRIQPRNLHEGSLYNGSNWILPFDDNAAFLWKEGAEIRFKISKTVWENQNAKAMHQLIFLRADEQGLGPKEWWM